MRTRVIVAAVLGFLVSVLCGFVRMLFFSSTSGTVHFICYLLPYLVCPQWVLGDGRAIWMVAIPLLNAALYAGIVHDATCYRQLSRLGITVGTKVGNFDKDERSRTGWLEALVLLLLIPLGLVVYAFAITATASTILRDVSALRVGVSSIQQVEEVAARHQLSIQDEGCDGRKCFVAFEVYNTWLDRLKLEPVAKFRAYVSTLDGTVNYIGIGLWRYTKGVPASLSGGMTSEYRTAPAGLFDDVSTSYGFPGPVGKPYIWAAVTTKAEVWQHQHAYAYSLKCLTKPGRGCDLPRDYLPLASRDWEDELNQRRLVFRR